MSANISTVRLPAVLDAREAAPLAATLLSMRGKPVSIDASRVERMGALGLQVLVSACATWKVDGMALSVGSASAAFEEAMALFGANLDAGGTCT